MYSMRVHEQRHRSHKYLYSGLIILFPLLNKSLCIDACKVELTVNSGEELAWPINGLHFCVAQFAKFAFNICSLIRKHCVWTKHEKITSLRIGSLDLHSGCGTACKPHSKMVNQRPGLIVEFSRLPSDVDFELPKLDDKLCVWMRGIKVG